MNHPNSISVEDDINWGKMMQNLAENGHKMTPELQKAIAEYISYQQQPKMYSTNTKVKL